MKFARVLSRLIILLVAASALVGLTAMYGTSARILPYPRFPFSPYAPSAPEQAEMRHQPPAPDVGYVTDCLGWGIWLAVWAVVGRKGFHLRLNRARRGEGRPILLGLLQLRQQSTKALPVPAGPPPPLR